MVLRLAFAVAAHVDPEILIVDEALAVGDIAFRQRCMRKIHELRAQRRDHPFRFPRNQRREGALRTLPLAAERRRQELGEADDVVAKYLSATLHRETAKPGTAKRNADDAGAGDTPHPGFVPRLRVRYRRSSLRRRPRHHHRRGPRQRTPANPFAPLTPLERLVLRISFRANAPMASPIAGFLCSQQPRRKYFRLEHGARKLSAAADEPGRCHNVDFHWSVPDLAPGAYRISLAVSDGNVEDFEVCDYIEDAIELKVDADRASNGNADRLARLLPASLRRSHGPPQLAL